MKDREKDNVILERAVEEAERLGLPGFEERVQNFLQYAQSVGHFDKLREISRRAQAAGTLFSREIEAARASGELPTALELEEKMLLSRATIH